MQDGSIIEAEHRPVAAARRRDAPAAARRLPWIEVAPGSPYFVDDSGAPWTPIGQNDGVAWPDLGGLYRRRDPAAAERYLGDLAERGITCLRVMMECAHQRHRYLERPAGRFVPAMVQLWDDLFALCERMGLRILLTPVDTFWTWINWHRHPWNAANGGPFDRRDRLVVSSGGRQAIKDRLSFAVHRWGGSGALFAWDLWNEIHPAQALNSADPFADFIQDLSDHVRGLERRLYGRSHPQTVSLYGPEIWQMPHFDLRTPIFRHPALDFATIHIYRERSIDDPRDTVAPALAMARIVRGCLDEIGDGRPFLDTEHGPIHAFKDKKRTLPVAFDEQYFRHMSWAHLAAGGVGGGMRWPNRHPHSLTAGMRDAQAAMARVLPLIDWTRFRRENISQMARATGFHVVACGDADQAIAWMVRRGGRTADGMLPADTPPRPTVLRLPRPPAGQVEATVIDTRSGMVTERRRIEAENGVTLPLTLGADAAVILRRID